MDTPRVSFEDFTLPFISKFEDKCTAGGEIDSNDGNHGGDESDDDVAEDESLDPTDQLDQLETLVPSDAIFLGSIELEVDNWTSWAIEDRYFLIELHGEEFRWALFRITWDDNWGRYEWSCDARSTGTDDREEAARYMATRLFESWSIDLASRDNRAYRDFLAAL